MLRKIVNLDCDARACARSAALAMRRAAIVALSAVLVLGAGCDDGKDGATGPAGPAGPAGPSGDSADSAAQSGLDLELGEVTVSSDREVSVAFTIVDGEGNPLSLDDLDGNPAFILAWISVDEDTGVTKYQGYTVRTVDGASYEFGGMTVDPALDSAEQVGTDGDGTFEEVDDGSYVFTFSSPLPADYDANATHTVGVYATRASRAVVENEVAHFVPAGGDVSVMREVAITADCNDCHGDLAIHGGARKKVELCVLCHTDQTVDPETGENLDMGPMIHKIHRGENLGEDYLIVGFRQSPHDYSEVVYPQNILNCTKCHNEDEDDGAAQAHQWRTQPTRASCGSCHIDVDFETGENHSTSEIQQFDDQFCSNCHRDELVAEFDNSVPGAHVQPYESSLNPRLVLEITDVVDMGASGQPTVTFTIEDDDGPVAIADLNRVAIVFAGPATDYSQPLSDGRFTIQGGGSSGTLTEVAVGEYEWVAPAGFMIPADAEGTWAVGMEARTEGIDVNGDTISFGANNPVEYIDVADGTLGGGSPTARREVSEDAKCDACHGDLILHGNLRTELEYCVLCHNGSATDEDRRPGVDGDTNPPESIDMEYMVHKIHRGEDLANGYVVYGFGGSEHDYGHVVYPGNLADCETCHVSDSQLLPLPDDLAATVVNIGGTTVDQDNAIRTPSTAACTGCHDSDDTFTHARLNSIIESETDWGEACSVCHGDGDTADAAEAHAANL